MKKYVNNAQVTTKENGTTKQMTGSNIFYLDHNKLIKVEESATRDGKKFDALWYYENDQPIYYTLQSEKSEERAQFLLTTAKAILQQVGFK